MRTAVERMQRFGATNCTRDAWNRWARYMRRLRAEEIRRLKDQLAAQESNGAKSAGMVEQQLADFQHEVGALLNLHNNACQARNEARQISEAAEGQRADHKIRALQARHDSELEAFVMTNQRLRNALLTSLAEAAGASPNAATKSVVGLTASVLTQSSVRGTRETARRTCFCENSCWARRPRSQRCCSEGRSS